MSAPDEKLTKRASQTQLMTDNQNKCAESDPECELDTYSNKQNTDNNNDDKNRNHQAKEGPVEGPKEPKSKDSLVGKGKVGVDSASKPEVKGGQTPGNYQRESSSSTGDSESKLAGKSTGDSEGNLAGKSGKNPISTSAVKGGQTPENHQGEQPPSIGDSEGKPTGNSGKGPTSTSAVKGGQTPENHQGEQPPSIGDSGGKPTEKSGKSPASASAVKGGQTPKNHQGEQPPSIGDSEGKPTGNSGKSPASTSAVKGGQTPENYQGEQPPSTGYSENKPRRCGVEDSDPNIQQEKKITVSKELILFIIMTSTIIATMAALVPVLYLWSDNYKVNQELHQLQTQLADVNKRLEIPDHVRSDKDDDVSDLAAEMWKTKERLKKAEIQLGQCINTTSDIVKEIKGTKFNLSEAINKTQVEAWRNLTRDREETTKYISSNFMSYAKWFPIIGTGLIVELLMVVFGVYLYSKWANRHYEPHTGHVNHEHPRRQNGAVDVPQIQDKTHNKTDEFQGMKWVLSRIKGKKLHNKVCVISFYQETSDKHVQLTRSTMESVDALQNVKVEPVVINKHGELLEIPACKIFIMFVDYNQRNVILEDTKKVLGDLKLTTARAIQKFNADLILVYVGHKESGELRAEHLYNTDITSVQLHPDLKEISHKKRFLSTYKQFTTFQKEHINKILKAKLL